MRLGLISACTTLAGCASGTVSISELNFKRIPADQPLTARVTTEQCAWWMDEDHLRVGLRHRRPDVWGRSTGVRFDLSLVLPGIPAGPARDYKLDTNSLRCYHRCGANHARFVSVRGIVGIWREAGDTLRGRFRLIATKQVFHILTGWTSVGQVYMEGRFRARHDRRLTESILRVSEKDGMDRNLSRHAWWKERPGPVRVTGPPVGNRGP